MNLTAITCTHDRPDAFRLCERYMAAQTIQPTQWIVLDDGESPAKCNMGQEYYYLPHCRGAGSMVNKLEVALRGNIIKGDAVAFWEDDDYYDQSWLAWCIQKLASFDLVGEGKAIYYNVMKRWWFDHHNMQHASLCSTAMTRAVLPTLLSQCSNHEPFIDSRLWPAFQGKKQVFNNQKRLVIGIKAMPGKTGYGGGHKAHDPCEKPDPDLTKLRELTGDRADDYAQFYIPDPKPVVNNSKSDWGRVHGPNWIKWVGHLAGRDDLVGMTVGMDAADAADWLKAHIFTSNLAALFTLASFPGPPVPPLDLLFIDGLHDSKNVLRDSVLGFELVKVGGLLIWDDYRWAQKPDPLDRPGAAIDSFLAMYARQLQVIAREGQVAAIKIA